MVSVRRRKGWIGEKGIREKAAEEKEKRRRKEGRDGVECVEECVCEAEKRKETEVKWSGGAGGKRARGGVKRWRVNGGWGRIGWRRRKGSRKRSG